MKQCSRIARDRLVKAALAVVLLGASPALAAQRYSATGLVLKMNYPQKTITVSCDSIPGYMDAMVMSFPLRGLDRSLKLEPGAKITFTVVADTGSVYAENIKVEEFQSLEEDPAQARRLHMLEEIMAPPSAADRPLKLGEPVPDFRLVDQNRQPISLNEFSGKVVAITFVYSRCPFPSYCYRLSNNFGRLQKRFRSGMGKDLVLLSIVIDPAHDQPAEVAEYARIWKADARGWHFLSGPLPEIKRVTQKFDMHFYPEEALFVHSFHTVVVDRQGRLAANVEGNDFSAEQLGDLVETVLQRRGNGESTP